MKFKASPEFSGLALLFKLYLFISQIQPCICKSISVYSCQDQYFSDLALEKILYLAKFWNFKIYWFSIFFYITIISSIICIENVHLVFLIFQKSNEIMIFDNSSRDILSLSLSHTPTEYTVSLVLLRIRISTPLHV